MAREPHTLADLPCDTLPVFQRLSLPEIARAAGASGSLEPAREPRFPYHGEPAHGLLGARGFPRDSGASFTTRLGDAETVARSFDRLGRGARPRSRCSGVYHVEPQSSAYPASFPTSPSPSHWNLGETYAFTRESVFWFNFFPAQPYLFEKTFAAWASFQTERLAARGENNQLVSSEGEERLVASGVDPFVQVNLNRFTSLPGFVDSAREAGKQTFTGDADDFWYGMQLRKL